MSRSLIVVLLCFTLSIGIPAYSQSNLESSEKYKDFVLDGDTVWLLTTNGILKRVKLKSGQPVKPMATIDSTVLAIAKDRKGNIIIGDTARHLKQYNKPTNQWKDIATYSGKLTGIVFTSQNHCLLVTQEGIVDPIHQITYFPDSTYSSNEGYWLRKKKWMATPTSFLDSHDCIWLGFNYGEWGGDVFAFDTKQTHFIQLKAGSVRMNSNPVFAFCEDSNNIYMSGGVSHMTLTHGSIVRFNKYAASTVLLSKDRETPIKVTSTGPDGKEKAEIWTTWTGGHRIGPVAYNPVDKCLYFYSQFGIHKGTPSTDLSDINQWHNILKPKLQGSEGQQFAAGPGMNVQKMVFAPDGTLFVLADHEGLGIYTKNELRFIK